MKRVRSDKKFPVKVWVKKQDKNLFRLNCFKYHLSMMFVGEKYLTTCLNDFHDDKLKNIIEDRLTFFYKMNSRRDNYETIGIKLTNKYWQKLAYFAVMYDTTVSKVSSCLFDYCLSAYELRGIEEQHGLNFVQDKSSTNRQKFDKRTSDYY